MMAKKPTLGSLLRSARLEKGLTLQRVGEAVGVTGSAVAHWESGLNVPSNDNLTAVCKALKLSVRNMREIAAR
jgi:transcriptional regulator with XRE-family HTH domain